jgi:hypothetical protein
MLKNSNTLSDEAKKRLILHTKIRIIVVLLLEIIQTRRQDSNIF